RLDEAVTPELERVQGVSSVAVIGAPEEIIQITPDEQKLAANGLTENDISTALDANGLSLPGGSVTDGDRTLDVVLGQEIDSIESLKGIMLMPEGGSEEGQQGQQDQPGQQGQQAPQPVALSEVATVERTTQEPT